MLGAIGVAVLAPFVPGLRTWAEQLYTLVHEGGHVLVGLLTGRRVDRFEITRRGGATHAPGEGWFSDVLTTMAGYLFPPAVGLSLIAALYQGISPRTVLLVALAVPVVLLVLSTRGRTVVVVTAVLVAFAVLLNRAGALAQATAIVTVAVLLLVAGLRYSLLLVRLENERSDDELLAERTGVPRAFWIVVFVGFAAAALYLAGRLLLTQPAPVIA